jgi:transposase-like protein
MSQQQSIKQQQQQSTQPNLNGKLKAEVPDPEVVPRAERRHFAAEYKLRILAEAEQYHEPGQLGALLRREGLYSSHLTRWRQLRDQGQLQALDPQKRGRKTASQAEELAQLRHENQRLRAQLEQAEWVMEAQKKLSQLLGRMNETSTGERR